MRDEERFWEKVNKNGPENQYISGQCWIWTGGITKFGHGRFRLGQKLVSSHRFAFSIQQEIPDGLWVLHKCNNPSCVRFDHLYIGTPTDNIKYTFECKRRQLHRRCGEKSSSARLNEIDVIEIRRLLSEGVPALQLSKKFQVGYSTIMDIKFRRTWYCLDRKI
jgi:hypothetical protein